MTLSQEQIDARSGANLGGSDMPEVCGLRGSAVDLYLEKRHEKERSTERVLMFEMGHAIEPVCLSWFEKTTEKVLIDETEYAEHLGDLIDEFGNLRHPKYEWWVGHLDGAVIEDGIFIPVEAKAADSFKRDHWGQQGDDMIPAAYAVQCQSYLALTGAPYMYLAVVIGMFDFRWYRIERAKDVINYLIEEGSKFVQKIKDGIPPTPRTVEDAKAIWPTHNVDEFIEADSYLVEDLRELCECSSQMTFLETRQKRLQLRVLKVCEAAEGVKQGDLVLATLKEVKRKGHTVKASTSRVLRPTKKNLGF